MFFHSISFSGRNFKLVSKKYKKKLLIKCKIVMDRVIWKISVAGIKGSGKTSLISRIVYGSDGSSGPIKALFRKRLNLEHDNSKLVADLLFQEINDDSDAERMLLSSNLILVTADILTRDGLEYAKEVIIYAKNFERKPPVILVGTKADLRYEAELWNNDFEKLARKLDVPFFILSSRTGERVNDLMDHVVELLVERYYAKKQSP